MVTWTALITFDFLIKENQVPNKDLLPARHGLCGGGEIPYSIKHSTKTGLYTTYKYPEFVPVVTIEWAELETIPR
jgi:hypothetical protein